MDDAIITAVTESPWLVPVLFALVVGDAFLVVLPSETVVVALGAAWSATGQPIPLVVVAVAAIGAVIGDSLCFAIGRRVGLERWAWQRRGRLGAAVRRVRTTVLSRPATLVFTARYIPFARIAVNLAAGASGMTYRRFLPLSATACLAWAVYNFSVGAVVGSAFTEMPVVGILVSIVVAVVVGVLIDAVVARVSRRRAHR